MLAAVLLSTGTTAQFAWRFVPTEHQADAWNISQATFVLALLGIVAATYRDPLVWRVCALAGAWQLLTAGCSLAYIVSPWAVLPGQGQCAAGLKLPLGIVSSWLAGVVAAELWRCLCRRNSNRT